MEYSGICSCGEVELILSLPKPLKHYQPRACDCDFCTERGISYISDPDGQLTIVSDHSLKVLKQGSEQAQFLRCPNCPDVVAVTYDDAQTVKGAINASLLSDKDTLQDATSASPKQISGQEKLMRWRQLWLNVEFTASSASD